MLPAIPSVEQMMGRNSFVFNMKWSVLWCNDSLFFARLFFAVWLAVLAALIVGYRTRTATILNWICIVSSSTRNMLVLNGGLQCFFFALQLKRQGDDYARVISFWMMFLPLSSCYSVDAALSHVDPIPQRRGVRCYTWLSVRACTL
jgi:hypothetical protein